ncbi:MAG: hypothetical protein AB2748_18315 [Candidatus Thiodiazotropha endolucinida]
MAASFDRKLEMIKEIYEDLLKLEPMKKGAREKILKNAREAAKALKREIHQDVINLETLKLPKPGESRDPVKLYWPYICPEDDRLLQRLDDEVSRFLSCTKNIKYKNAPNLRGVPRDKLIANLAKLCDDPTCKHDRSSDNFYGPFVDFLDQHLQKIIPDANEITVQAFARRYSDLKRAGKL